MLLVLSQLLLQATLSIYLSLSLLTSCLTNLVEMHTSLLCDIVACSSDVSWMLWSTTPACPSLVCFYNKENIEQTSCCVCMYVFCCICVGIDFVHLT